MGIEKLQIPALNAAVQGKPFQVHLGKSVNQLLMGLCLGLMDAEKRGVPEEIAASAAAFRRRVEQQIGVEGPDASRRGACGLYALQPTRAGLVRAECRTTSHCHLHYAWLSAGLWATRDYRDEADGLVSELELHRLSDALLDWLWWELSWSAACYVPGVGVLAPNRRHRRGKTHEIVLTSPDRDNLYLMAASAGAELDSKYWRQALRRDNAQQLGFRTIHDLLGTGDLGVVGVFQKIRSGSFAPVVFWDRLEVARRGDDLVAWVPNMERKGRDDTAYVDAIGGSWLAGDLNERLPALSIHDGWTRATFLGHAEAA